MDYKELVENNFKESSLLITKFQNLYSGLIVDTSGTIVQRIKKGGGVYFMGNGGSAADSMHLTAELMGRFYLNRKPIKAYSLNTNCSMLTEIPNDFSFAELFERQIEALVQRNDTVIGISTSGNSENVINGFKKSRQIGAYNVGFTGKTGGIMAEFCDVCFKVPSEDTPRIQECHITLGHTICQLIEDQLFSNKINIEE